MPFGFFHREKIILKLHRHPIVLLLEIFPLLVLLCAPFIIFLIFKNDQFSFGQSAIFLFAFALFRDVFSLVIFLFILYVFFSHYLDVWLVTEHHIINIEQKSLFNKSIAEQEIDRVQDITAEVNGPLQTIFNYGNIYIQTAGTQERFIFKDVAHPRLIVDEITKILDEKEEQKKAL